MCIRDSLHLCLLAVDADIPSALRIRPDMMGMKKFDVHIRPVSYTHLPRTQNSFMSAIAVQRVSHSFTQGMLYSEVMTAVCPFICVNLILLKIALKF